mgnify:CR=1 FL=1
MSRIIKQIEIEGLKAITENEFLNALSNVGIKVGSNLIETYLIKLGEKIKKAMPEVKSVRIKRNLPNRIKFIVTEREPIGTVEIDGKLVAIDDENVCFVTNRDISNLPQIMTDIDKVSDGVKLLKALNEMNRNIYFLISKVYNINDRFTLLLKSNTKIFWGEYSDNVVDTQLKLLNKTLQDAESRFRNIEYIDLRLFNEGRVILKPI